jgi:DNA adenine methylase
MDKSLPAFFGRVGSKRSIKEKIYRMMPKDYDKFIEPFVGGGAIYFGLKSNKPAVINDLDSELMKNYKIMKQGVTITPAILQKYKSKGTVPELNKILNSPASGGVPYIVKSLAKYNSTFGNTGEGKVYRSRDLVAKLKKVPEYTEKLKNTTILSQDYGSVIKRYDSSKAFFYLDPPYEDSQKLYKKGDFDFERLAKILRGIKGKFLLSLNDSSNIRNIFKGFKISGITDGGIGNSGIGEGKRREVIIKNY